MAFSILYASVMIKLLVVVYNVLIPGMFYEFITLNESKAC